MANQLNTSKTKIHPLKGIYVIDETVQSDLYNDILDDDIVLSAGFVVQVIDENGESQVRLVGAESSVWSEAFELGFSDSKQELIDSVDAVTSPDATDEATAIDLVNEIKEKFNELLGTLKTLN